MSPFKFRCLSLILSLYIYIHTYIHIYIYRERERANPTPMPYYITAHDQVSRELWPGLLGRLASQACGFFVEDLWGFRV